MRLCSPVCFQSKRQSLGVGVGEAWFSRQGGHSPVFCGIGMVLDPGIQVSPTYQRASLSPSRHWGEDRVLSGCPPETYMVGTGSWKPSPTLMRAGCSGLESGLVEEQAYTPCLVCREWELAPQTAVNSLFSRGHRSLLLT